VPSAGKLVAVVLRDKKDVTPGKFFPAARKKTVNYRCYTGAL
jgi:hypothetical protein